MTLLRRIYNAIIPERDLLPNSKTNALRVILTRKTWHSFSIGAPRNYPCRSEIKPPKEVECG